jgi:hypothetical protein
MPMLRCKPLLSFIKHNFNVVVADKIRSRVAVQLVLLCQQLVTQLRQESP